MINPIIYPSIYPIIKPSMYSGPLDILGNVSNCVLGISPFKRLSRIYDDWLVLVVRVDDLEERFFYADKFGNIDTYPLLNWLAGSNGVVKMVANQVKPEYPAYQNTLAYMPRISNSGVFDIDGLKFDGVDDRLIFDNYSELSITEPPLSMYSNHYQVSAGYLFTRNDASASTIQYGLYNIGTFRFYLSGGIRASIPNPVGERKTIASWQSKSANGVKLRNGTYSDIGTYGVTLTDRPNTQIGARGLYGVFFDGSMKVILVYNSDEYNKYNKFVKLGL